MLKTVLLAGLALTASHVFGGPATQVYFGAPDFVWHASGGGSPNHIWTAGDYWEQDFTGTGVASINTATLNAYYNDNMLAAGNPLDLSVLINGTTVGAFVIHPGDLNFNTYVFNFGTIFGPNYDIQILATNTIAFGEGSVSMADSGTNSNLALGAIPEPATFGMMAAGLVALLALRRRSCLQNIADR